jgi:hypothetical protein
MSQGFVYVLVSPNSDFIKIGGTEHPVAVRLKQINGTASYGDHGPWILSDFLHVTDWQKVERGMHEHFATQKIRDVAVTRELFSAPPHSARTQLRLTEPSLRVDHEKTAQLFKDRELKLFLFKLFQLSGLFGNLDIQGSWTLSILTSTMGGRWFTLNIGPHEVAFSTKARNEAPPVHHVVLDRLILDYPKTILWIGKHGGAVEEADYKSGRGRAVIVSIQDDFGRAEKIFGLPGVRRALIAYWFESLADLRERSAKSTYARYHSYDAVAELLEYKRAAEQVFVLPAANGNALDEACGAAAGETN